MGIEPLLLSSVLTAVVAQRLVRRLCPACREERPTEDALVPIFVKAGIAVPEHVWHPVGCPQCSNTGYAGRMAIFELLIVDQEIAALILARQDTRAIAAAAGRKAMRSLLHDGFVNIRFADAVLHDGLRRAVEGVTAVEEVLRVVSED